MVSAGVTDGPGAPVLDALPAVSAQTPVTVAWSHAAFTPGSLARAYEVVADDRGGGPTITHVAPVDLASQPQRVAVPLLDGHDYRVEVRALETVCQGSGSGVPGGEGCSRLLGGFSERQLTRVSVPAPAAPRVALPAPRPAPQPAPPTARAKTPRPRVGGPVGGALARLINPRPGAAVRSGTLRLRWRPDRRARYYNIQLYARSRKVLTRWPSGPALRVNRLAPGRYRIVVWSGIGPQERARYAARPWVDQRFRVLTVRVG